jgi:hypothetical protein
MMATKIKGKDFTLIMTGNTMVTKRVLQLAKVFPAAAAVALNLEAVETLADAVKLTPRDKGGLQRSGRVSRLAKAKKLEALIRFGKFYALAVHEIPAPPQRSVGGRSARHYPPFGQGGQWKYLETALFNRLPKFSKRIADDIDRIVPSMYHYKDGMTVLRPKFSK